MLRPSTNTQFLLLTTSDTFPVFPLSFPDKSITLNHSLEKLKIKNVSHFRGSLSSPDAVGFPFQNFKDIIVRRHSQHVETTEMTLLVGERSLL